MKKKKEKLITQFNMMLYLPQKLFPFIEEYKKVFDVTDKTIFAYNNVIYCNEPLPEHLERHETIHLKRQNKIGCDIWVTNYLRNPMFRLKEEVIAYREQLECIKDRNERNTLRIQCAKDLSSPLYGSICTYADAYNLLLLSH